MKNKKDVYGTLTQILKCYESYRHTLEMTTDKAIEKTLETYSNFYDWLKEDKMKHKLLIGWLLFTGALICCFILGWFVHRIWGG